MIARSIVVLAGAAITAALWFAGRERPARGPNEADAMASAQSVASWLRERAAALHARAATLAELPRLGAAVATDAATVRDLTHDELGFTLLPDESVELGQLDGERATSLLRMPESARAADFGKLGVQLASDPKGLVITETIPIVLRNGMAPNVMIDAASNTKPPPTATDAARLRGAIAVSWRFEPAALSAATDAGILATAEGELAIGRGVPDGAHTARVMLPGMPSDAALVTALGVEAKPASWPFRIGGIAFGLACAITAVCWPSRRRARQRVAAAEQPSASTEPVPGARFGRYEPIMLVGSGDTANVYVARATGEAGFERRVRLKVLGPTTVRDPRAMDAVLAAAQKASRISHPNLVEVLDLGRSGNAAFVATEYIDGGDLERLFEQLRATGKQVPLGIAIAIARRICDGLDAAHTAVDERGEQLGMLHGGVRAASVLVSRSGTVKVGDFGFSAARTSSARVELDTRVDVYGVGAILYALLTGHELGDVDVRSSLATLPPLVGTRADIPSDVDAIVRRALAHDRERRYPTCADLELDLARVAEVLGLEMSDRDIGQWIVREIAGWSPTLRGWPAAATETRR